MARSGVSVSVSGSEYYKVVNGGKVNQLVVACRALDVCKQVSKEISGHIRRKGLLNCKRAEAE